MTDTTATTERFIRVTSRTDEQDAIASYLPANYALVGQYANGDLAVVGHDNAGWTAEDYVIPRLGSGLIVAHVASEGPSYVFDCDACLINARLGGGGPRHYAISNCRSGGRAHCTCDGCF